jgi:hypothetical protein
VFIVVNLKELLHEDSPPQPESPPRSTAPALAEPAAAGCAGQPSAQGDGLCVVRTMTPLTPGEVAARRVELVRLWRLKHQRLLDLRWSDLQQEIATRGCTPIESAARTFRSATGTELHLIDGGKRMLKIVHLPNRGPGSDGPRAA